jgi:hypothetical protein
VSCPIRCEIREPSRLGCALDIANEIADLCPHTMPTACPERVNELVLGMLNRLSDASEKEVDSVLPVSRDALISRRWSEVESEAAS